MERIRPQGDFDDPLNDICSESPCILVLNTITDNVGAHRLLIAIQRLVCVWHRFCEPRESRGGIRGLS